MVGRGLYMLSRVSKVSAGIIAHLAHHVPTALILVGKKIMKKMIGAKNLGFFSSRSLRTIKKYISLAQSVFLSLYIF